MKNFILLLAVATAVFPCAMVAQTKYISATTGALTDTELDITNA